MTKDEREQLIKLFWDLCDTVCMIQPDIGRVFKREEIDTSKIEVRDLQDMMNLLHFNTLYTVFDLEACRRDINKLVGIIKSNEKGDDEGSA